MALKFVFFVVVLLAATGVDGAQRRRKSFNESPKFSLDRQLVINLGSGASARGVSIRKLGPIGDKKTYPTDILDLRPPQLVEGHEAIPVIMTWLGVKAFSKPGQTYYWKHPTDEGSFLYCTVSIDALKCDPEEDTVAKVDELNELLEEEHNEMLDKLTKDSRIYIAGHGGAGSDKVSDDEDNSKTAEQLAQLIATEHIQDVFATDNEDAPELRISLVVCMGGSSKKEGVPGEDSLAGQLVRELWKRGVRSSVLGRMNKVKRATVESSSWDGPQQKNAKGYYARHGEEYFYSVSMAEKEEDPLKDKDELLETDESGGVSGSKKKPKQKKVHALKAVKRDGEEVQDEVFQFCEVRDKDNLEDSTEDLLKEFFDGVESDF